MYNTFLLQLWRLITTFLFFGTIGFNFFFNMIFTYRYCRMLEEGSFRGRTADFVVMFLFGGALMIVSFGDDKISVVEIKSGNISSIQSCLIHNFCISHAIQYGRILHKYIAEK
jgi:hypothetical protein